MADCTIETTYRLPVFRQVSYTADTPVPYRLVDLISLIDERMGKLENKRDLLVKVIEDWYENMLSDYDQQLAGITMWAPGSLAPTGWSVKSLRAAWARCTARATASSATCLRPSAPWLRI